MKKMLIVASVVMLLMCAFALTVSAEACVHEDSWEVKFGSEGELGSWEAINVCPKCGYVIANDFCQPLVVSRGYSYYQDSFTQGFEINHAMVDKYEEYTGNTFTYGFIAGIPEGLKGIIYSLCASLCVTYFAKLYVWMSPSLLCDAVDHSSTFWILSCYVNCTMSSTEGHLGS